MDMQELTCSVIKRLDSSSTALLCRLVGVSERLSDESFDGILTELEDIDDFAAHVRLDLKSFDDLLASYRLTKGGLK